MTSSQHTFHLFSMILIGPGNSHQGIKMFKIILIIKIFQTGNLLLIILYLFIKFEVSFGFPKYLHAKVTVRNYIDQSTNNLTMQHILSLNT